MKSSESHKVDSLINKENIQQVDEEVIRRSQIQMNT